MTCFSELLEFMNHLFLLRIGTNTIDYPKIIFYSYGQNRRKGTKRLSTSRRRLQNNMTLIPDCRIYPLYYF